MDDCYHYYYFFQSQTQLYFKRTQSRACSTCQGRALRRPLHQPPSFPIEHDGHFVNHGPLSVATMTCPQSGQQHSKEYPSKPHFLIQFGHF